MSEYISRHIYFQLNRTEAWWSSLHVWNANVDEASSGRKETGN